MNESLIASLAGLESKAFADVQDYPVLPGLGDHEGSKGRKALRVHRVQMGSGGSMVLLGSAARRALEGLGALMGLAARQVQQGHRDRKAYRGQGGFPAFPDQLGHRDHGGSPDSRAFSRSLGQQSAEDALYAFRGAYGRYAALAANLLTKGATRESIVRARTTRINSLPAFVEVYNAWAELNRHLEALKARDDVREGDMAEVVRQAKRAVEQEFGVSIPVVTP